jgi:hypothetical protein
LAGHKSQPEGEQGVDGTVKGRIDHQTTARDDVKDAQSKLRQPPFEVQIVNPVGNNGWYEHLAVNSHQFERWRSIAEMFHQAAHQSQVRYGNRNSVEPAILGKRGGGESMDK